MGYRIPLPALLFLAAVAALRAGDAGGPGYVLWLHSYHPADWSESLHRGIRTGLGPGVPLQVEFMDAKRRSDAPYLDVLAEALRLKHQGRPLRAVIASDDDAARFAVQHQPGMFADVPVVWCGVNRFEPGLLADGRATGVIEEIDAEATLALAFRLRPQAAAIHVICDSTTTAGDNLTALRETLLRLHPQRRVQLVRDLPLEHLADHLAALPADDVAFFVSFWRDGAGRPVEPDQLALPLRRSACPVLGRSEWMIGRGQLGGLCVSGEEHGRAAAAIAGRLLAGEAAAAIPPSVAPNIWVFDAAELERHGIAVGDLPPGSEIRHIPPSLLRDHPWQVAIAAAVLGVLGALSVALGASALRRRRAERALAAERSVLSAVLDQSMHFMGILDPDGRVMLVNQSSLALIGGTLSDIVGRPFWETVWWSHDAGLAGWLREAVRSVAAGGPPVRRLVTHRGRDGLVRSVDFSLTASRLPDGSLRLVPEGRDVTELIEARDRLAESEARFRQLAEHIDAVFWLLERGTGRVLYVSPACRRVWGRGPEELSARPWAWLDAVHPDDRDRAARCVDAGAAQAEFRVRLPDGSERHIRQRSYAVAGAADRVVGIAEDVTELTRLEGEVRQAQRLQLLRQLAGGVAHDFNNALAGILGNAELALVDPGLSEPSQQRLRTIAATASRAGSVTRQLLAFARADAPERRSFDLVQVVADAVTLARPAMRSAIELVCEPMPHPLPVEGDAGLVQNAILNLLLNARDALLDRPEGGRVVVRCFRRAVAADDPLRGIWHIAAGDYAAVAVADNGCGIDPTLRERIFEPFFTTKPAGSGSGLGLATVHGTATGHAGAVQLASWPGAGTEFTLLLPLPSAAASPPSATTILVVDDEPVVREVTAQLLRSMGHQVRVAADGVEAVECVRAGGIDLVVLDMVMPRLDGREALRRIRLIDPRLPVLMLSGWSEAGGRQLLLEGATAVLGKPLVVAELRREISEALAARA